MTGSSSARVIETGHAISIKESYLGLQDALQKLRSPHGTHCQGAWAGSNVYIDNKGVMVLVSQEKWDRLKGICAHWLAVIQRGETELEYKKLLLDRDFWYM